ncbi:MAG: hypothetical protein JHC29_03830 [Thermoplasmata archaeon]|nr:hypothetical protein [Thermoplasmata archaeon]
MLYEIILPEIGGERDEKPVLVNEVTSDEVALSVSSTIPIENNCLMGIAPI